MMLSVRLVEQHIQRLLLSVCLKPMVLKMSSDQHHLCYLGIC